jgi:phosphoenolpyruvate carboxykinase (ATP)
MFGTVLENVVLDDKRRVEFEDQSITENTPRQLSDRLHPQPRPERTRRPSESTSSSSPRCIRRAAADRAACTPEQAMYYFLSATRRRSPAPERGVTEPQATFSACFGAVFLVWHPTKYAEMLGDKLREHGLARVAREHGLERRCSMVSASGMKLGYTRAMVRAALAGQLDQCRRRRMSASASRCQTLVPGVPRKVMRSARYLERHRGVLYAQARKLAEMFVKNFEKFGSNISPASLPLARRCEPERSTCLALIIRDPLWNNISCRRAGPFSSSTRLFSSDCDTLGSSASPTSYTRRDTHAFEHALWRLPPGAPHAVAARRAR